MPPSLEELAWTVCAASALFNTGLFFEVHELLEPCWMRAEPPVKAFLQGLIQIAAGLHHEQNGNPRLTVIGVDQSISTTQGGGNLEGKEVRIGASDCGLFAGATTGTSSR